MGKRRIPPEEKRAAMLRIRAGSSSYRDEAKRVGLDPSTLHAGVKKMKEREEAAAPAPAAPAAAPPVDRALAAAGLAQKKDDTRPATPEELKAAAPSALEKDGDYCVSTLGQIKTLATLGGAMLKDINPLDERVFKLGQIGEGAQKEIRVASPELAPLLRKYLPEGSSLIGLVIVLLFDAAGTYKGLGALAEEYAAKREAAKEKAKAEGHHRPQQAPTTTGNSAHPPEPWMSKITDKPAA